MRRYLALSLATNCLSLCLPAQAEEGASGHYLPGSMASSIDATLTDPAFVARLNLIEYEGDVEAGVVVPVAGLAVADADVDLSVIGLTFAWRPEWAPSEKLSYAASLTVPFVDLTISATLQPEEFASSVRRTDRENGLGDIVLIPLMLNYDMGSHWRSDFRLSFYAPTGDYKVGRLANPGKNYWSVEPTVGLFYNNPKSGQDFAAFAGITFNQENSDTDYKSGHQFHMESTFTQHFPLWGGAGGIGATGFWYEQVTGDSGSGANLGDFKTRTLGIGPVLSYAKPLGDATLVAELKWLHEFDVKRRPEGDYLYLKVLAKF